MTDDDRKRYTDLVEVCARVIALSGFGLTNVELPRVVLELQIEAADLRGGWIDFDANQPAGGQHLPVVDAVTDEIFARANELRLGLFGMHRQPPPLRH
jgi:hypothetical protein